MPHQGARIHVDDDIGAGEFGQDQRLGLIGQIMRLDQRQRIIQLQMQLNEAQRARLAGPQIMDTVDPDHRDGQLLNERPLLGRQRAQNPRALTTTRGTAANRLQQGLFRPPQGGTICPAANTNGQNVSPLPRQSASDSPSFNDLRKLACSLLLISTATRSRIRRK